MRAVGARAAVLGLVALVAGCLNSYYEAPEQVDRRPLITDHLPYLLERPNVRSYYLTTGWCLAERMPHDDLYEVCDAKHGGIAAPEMMAFVRYDDADRMTSIALYVSAREGVPVLLARRMAVELDRRFGESAPVEGGGRVWRAPSADVGLAIVQHGDWVLETHQLRERGPGADR